MATASYNMSGMNTSGYTRNMSLPLSMNQPITVDENTPNLEQIQSFPVAGRTLDGSHFHQDPVTGQMYRMTDSFHDMIPQILANRMNAKNLTITIPTTNGNKTYNLKDVYNNFMVYVKNDNELVSQFYRFFRLDYLKDIEKQNKKSEKELIEINDEFYYTDNIDTVTNDIVIYSDGTYKLLGPSGLNLKSSPYTTSFEGANTTINTFSVNGGTPTRDISLSKYVPTNRFTNLYQGPTSLVGGINRYTPINKFYNR